ncbi:MAG: YitT family protein [Lachnospiraceae bacterium]|nr:YitT family protein [Lachnospiraceae bacterium]MDE6184060.1 YitT family protein [Lachnospiraceae bacterium]
MRLMKTVKKYVVITVAAVLFGAGISLFIDPNNLAPGGVSGLSIILSRLVPIETGTLFMLLNIPIIALGVWKFGWKFILSTLYAIFVSSAATNIFQKMEPLTKEPLLGALFGGVLVAIGLGYVLKSGATTGGTDIIVKCLKQKKPHLKTGTIFLVIDSIIIGIGGIVFGNMDTVLYSAVSAVATSQMLDLVLYGRDGAKMIYIISSVPTAITERILKELEVGVTYLSGTGAYKKEDKQVIFCVVKKQNAYKVEEIVKQEDSSAFMIISSAAEIYGEGYKSYFGEKL